LFLVSSVFSPPVCDSVSLLSSVFLALAANHLGSADPHTQRVAVLFPLV
jgi:hypothetical protein